MTRVFQVDPDRPERAGEALGAAADAVAAGLLVILPTETVYGIACRPDDPTATDRLFVSKRRPRDLSLPVLTGSMESAWEVAQPNEVARRLARSFWPGPLTMVLPRTEASRPWRLGREGTTVGVRVPNLTFALAVLERTGPLAVTSANISGAAPLTDGATVLAQFGESVAVALVAAAGTERFEGVPSTVVALTGPKPLVLRPGPLGADEIEAVAAGIR